ncbi:MAG: hypothetical protein WBN68_01365 [Sedimenticolaceae bacterium]
MAITNCLRVVCLAFLTAPLYAANDWFAKDMPISQMTEADGSWKVRSGKPSADPKAQ